MQKICIALLHTDGDWGLFQYLKTEKWNLKFEIGTNNWLVIDQSPDPEIESLESIELLLHLKSLHAEP